MHKKALPIGVDIFGHLIREKYYYVDKTNLIRDLLDTKGSVNLFTRPRRFGKTLNMSMLQYYFEDMRDRDGSKMDNRDLFEGLNIIQAGETYTSQMGQYPVIFLSLKEGKQNTFESALRQMSYGIQEEYWRHAYLMHSDRLEDDAKQRYNAFAYGKTQIDDYKDSLRFLSGCLEQYYNKKTIILIDEYDVPLENAFVRGFYDEMVDFMRAFLGVALKTNAGLHFAVLTGCLRISKESIFTGLNNLKIISILNDEYGEYFGFTESEVIQMCEYYGFPEKYGLVREWYNGYVFGGANVYNPWSVIQYMSDLRSNPNRYPEAYWANTSSNSEFGKGGSDLVVKPVFRRREAFIIEFKVAKKLAELGAKTDEALKHADIC